MLKMIVWYVKCRQVDEAADALGQLADFILTQAQNSQILKKTK